MPLHQICAAALLVTTGHVFALGSEDPASLGTEFYSKMSVRDLAWFQQHVPVEGFSEFIPETNQIVRLNQQAFEGLFNSGRQVDLRALDTEVQVFGDAAVVTGIRSGGIATASGPPSPSRTRFTMVWSKTAGIWQIRHLHISPIPAEK